LVESESLRELQLEALTADFAAYKQAAEAALGAPSSRLVESESLRELQLEALTADFAAYKQAAEAALGAPSSGMVESESLVAEPTGRISALQADNEALNDSLRNEHADRISYAAAACAPLCAPCTPLIHRSTELKVPCTVTSTLNPGKESVKAVIGKGGATIRDIQSKSNARVDVNVDEGTVTFKGTKEAVDIATVLAKNAMFGETQVVIELGSRGAVKVVQGDAFKTIRQLQDQFSVRLGILKGTTQLKFAGSKEAVAAAQKAVRDLLAHNRGMEIEIDHSKVGAVYGKAGANIRSIQETTGTSIEVDKSRSPALFTITGAPEAVRAAHALIQRVIDGEADLKPGEVQQSLELGTATLAIIGVKGAKVIALREKHNVRIDVNIDTSLCTVIGEPDLVAQAVAEIEDIARPIQERKAAQAAANKADFDSSIAVTGETGWYDS
jgi:polyribonucleotide nucleotidyltransferase